MTADSSGDVIFVAKFGSDTEACGRIPEASCYSLQHGLNISQSGDEIKLITDHSEPTYLYHCSRQPITKNLIIKGVGPMKPNLFCNDTILDGYQAPVLFYFENSTVNLNNLNFISSHILGSNVTLDISNCVFNHSVLFLMQKCFYKYYHDHILFTGYILSEVFYAFTYWTTWFQENAESFKGLIVPLCFSTFVNMYNVEWLPQKNEEPPPIDEPHQLGIQAICREINITITSTNMADNPVYLCSVTNLSIYISDTIFEGSEQGSVTQGGLKINSFCFPRIIIENCTFNHLKYNDIAFAQMAASKQNPAATYINIEQVPLPQFVPDINRDRISPTHYHSYIFNTTFTNNFRAIAVNALDSAGFQLQIKDVIFTNNQVINDGGALNIHHGENVWIDIENCEFLSNLAGVIPFYVGLTFPGYTIGDDLPTVYGFEIVSANLLRIDGEFVISGKIKNKTIQLNLRGDGGAISIQHGSIGIINSHFVNNTANNYGGAIYVGSEASYAFINDSSFQSAEISSTLLSGIFIQSYSKNVFIFDSLFEIMILWSRNISAVYHSRESTTSSLMTGNITVMCPVNARLVMHNTSSGHADMTGGSLLSLLQFTDLVYTCQHCSNEYYSLYYGYFRHIPEIIKGRRKRSDTNDVSPPPLLPPPPPPPPLLPYAAGATVIHHYNYTNVICHSCPYGGICNNGIQTKANNWGVQKNGVVTFYKCPTGYCCSESICDTYNTCSRHRHGTLCSRCKHGYSEALFSTKCLLNENCNQVWFIPITAVLIFIYAMFLLFQDNFTNFVFKQPIQKQSIMKTLIVWICKSKKRKCAPEPNTVTTDESPDEGKHMGEGGIFLILLFYYFQDATIVSFSPIYSQATDPLIALIKEFIGSLFDFQLDILVFVGNICPFPGLNSVRKIWLNLLPVPSLFIILTAVYLLSKLRLRKHSISNKRWEDMCGKASQAIMLAILFSYQKLASSAFSLVYCVPVQDDTVLFIDGSVKCLQNWQIAIFFYIYLCIVPFGFYISVAPSFLKSSKITIGEYFVGCFLPIPITVIEMVKRFTKMFTKKIHDNTPEDSKEAALVYGMLQGPYKDYHIPLPYLRYVPLCWEGILLVRRLCLIITYTYIHNIMLRLLIMTVISLVSLLHHLMVKPCKENRANVAGTVSCVALLSVCIINLVRATIEFVEVVAKGPLKEIMDELQLVEDCLLFWIPLVGACFVVLFLFARIAKAMIAGCKKRVKKQ